MDGRRILVVDDDAEARELLGEFLSDEGFAVETAADGPAALGKLDAFCADVVVTDLDMPGMDGLELIRRIEARYPGRPTLLVTARPDLPSGLVAPASGGGPLAYLRKPLDLDDLASVVNRLLQRAPGRAGRRPRAVH